MKAAEFCTYLITRQSGIDVSNNPQLSVYIVTIEKDL